MPYLNVAEVETALSVAASAPYSGFTQLITLPNLTWENRQCHAIKIANGGGPGRPGVYFLGGVHAREWGSSDILINFVEQLEQAYSAGTGLTFGGKSFSASDIQAIVNTLDIVVFPQANPDGRNYSMTVDIWWRKNRRTAPPNSNSGDCVGVDVNRNYDFLWDFPTYYDPSAPVNTSTDPCDYQVYHGPSAFSEPETCNAKWIFDAFANVRFFIDVHSFGEDILYSWGDDDDQTTDPNMNFQNPAYNGKRGITDASGLPGAAAYKEYIPAGDQSSAIDLANTFRDGIQAVRGTTYTVKSAVNLYPTSGTSDDYAFSRHIVDSSKQKVLAYVLEWGTEFQPHYNEMQNIIQEITAGLLSFCLWVYNSVKPATPTVVMSGGPFTYDCNPHQASAVAQGAGGVPVAGTFTYTYSPGGGPPVNAGTYTVVANFTSSDPNYTNATGTGTLTINPATPTVVVSGGPFTYDGNARTASAVATGCSGNVVGTFSFTYTPGGGPPVNAGTYAVVASFTSSDPNYTNATGSGTLVINRQLPTITWADPADIDHGVALDGTQLNAKATGVVKGSPVVVPGKFTYDPAAGTVLDPGLHQPLKVGFVPTDPNFLPASKTVHINVRGDKNCWTRIDFEFPTGKDRTTGARAGWFEIREVLTGRLLAVWYPVLGSTDSGCFSVLRISFHAVAVTVVFHPDGVGTPILMKVLNPGDAEGHGWIAFGGSEQECAAIEVEYP